MNNKKLNDISRHRLEIFDKFKNEVLKWFKEQVSVKEMNARLKKAGARTDMANYILIKLGKKKMGNVPEKKWIKRDQAFVMAANEKDAKPKAVKKVEAKQPEPEAKKEAEKK